VIDMVEHETIHLLSAIKNDLVMLRDNLSDDELEDYADEVNATLVKCKTLENRLIHLLVHMALE